RAANGPPAGGGTTATAPGSAGRQLIYLDFDGAADLTYNDPITIVGISIPAFQSPSPLAGQERDIAVALAAALNLGFAGLGVTFTTQQPADGLPYSTIYIGGDSSAFSRTETYYGLSEKTDEGNQDPADNAFVFPRNIPGGASSATEYAQA